MPITLRKFNAQVKDPETGEMVPAGLLSSDSIEAIEEAETAAVAAVESKQAAAEAAIELKGETTRESIPADYTELNDEIDDVKAQYELTLTKNAISGDYAAFSNGVAGTEISPFIVNINSAQGSSGWTAAKVTRCGKNLLDPDINSYKVKSASTYRYINNVVPKGVAAVMSFRDKDTTVDVSGINIGFTSNDLSVENVSLFRWVMNNGVIQGNRSNSAAQNGSIICGNVFIYPSSVDAFNRLFARYDIQVEIGSESTVFEPYAGNVFDVPFPSGAGTVSSGVLNLTEGTLSVGSTTPVVYTLDPVPVAVLAGNNIVWADCGSVDIMYAVDIEKLVTEKTADIADHEERIDALEAANQDVIEYLLKYIDGERTDSKTISWPNNNEPYIADATQSFYIVRYPVTGVDAVVVSGTTPNNGCLYIYEDENGNMIDHYADRNSSGTVAAYRNIKSNVPEDAKYLVVSGHISSLSVQAAAGIIEGYKLVNAQAAGYNPIPVTYKNQAIVASTGTADITQPIDNPGCMCYVAPCSHGNKFTINSSGREAALAWMFVDTDGVILKSATTNIVNNTVETAPANSAYLIINDYNEGVSLYGRTSSQTIVDEVTGTDYMQNAITRIAGELKSKTALGNTLVFGFSTDQHIRSDDNMNYTAPVIRGLKALSKLTQRYPYDFICLGGDLCNTGTAGVQDPPEQIVDEVMRVIEPLHDAWCPVIPVTGNHESHTNNHNMVGEPLFNAFFKRITNTGIINALDTKNTNGYIDFKVQKVRAIFLDSMSRADYTAADRTSALTSMLSGTPEGYSIVIYSHYALNKNIEVPGEDEWNTNMDYQTLLSDYKDRIICCVCGHNHRDRSATADGILYISTTNAACQTSGDGKLHPINTEDETAFDTFVVDQTNKMIYTFRYGQGENRTFDYDNTSSTFGEITE